MLRCVTPQPVICPFCREAIWIDPAGSRIYSRSTVVMHVVECPKKPLDASADDLTVAVDAMMERRRVPRLQGPKRPPR
jgi:hypothetical protein